MQDPPKKSTGRELSEKVLEGGASMVPIVGGPMGLALAFTMARAYNKRLDAWMQDVADAIGDLQEEQGWPSIDDLAENPTFVDAVVNATRAAQTTHQQEKLDALRHGVLNSIGPLAPTLDEQARFFRLVEQFSAAHLRLLAFFADPRGFFAEAEVEPPQFMSGGRMSVIKALPEFGRQPREWIELLDADLRGASLVIHGGLSGVQMGDSLYQPATSGLGARFLSFIRPPAGPLEPSNDQMNTC